MLMHKIFGPTFGPMPFISRLHLAAHREFTSVSNVPIVGFPCSLAGRCSPWSFFLSSSSSAILALADNGKVLHSSQIAFVVI